MAVQINIDNTSYDRVASLTLEGTEYKFHRYWNQRSGWYFSLYDADEYSDSLSDSDDAALIAGRKIIPNQVLLDNVTGGSFLTSGSLVCVDTTSEDDDRELTLDNFGTDQRFQLWYITSDDVEDYV